MSDTPPLIDILPEHWIIVRDILRKHVPHYAVWAFGSRARGTAKPFSDLDLAIITEKPLPLDISAALAEDFSESDLPYKVDLVDWATTGESFRQIIERDKVVVQEGKSSLSVLSGWRNLPFTQILTGPVRNGVYKSKEFHGRGAKIVNMGELFGHPRLRPIPMKRVELTDSETERFTLAEGDLIFARRSLTAEGAGKCSVVLELDEPTTFESSIIRARPDQEKANSLFLYYFFNSPLGFHALATIRRQVAVAGITGKDLGTLEIPVPPLHEQRAIAHILSTLDDKIELNRKMNKTLESIAQALFKSWFVDFDPVRAKMEGREPEGMDADTAALFSDDLEESELGLVPRGWRAVNIDHIADVIDCLHSKKPELLKVGRPFLQLNNIRDDGLLETNELACISDEDYKKWISRIEVCAGNCVITNVGRVGAVSQIPFGFEAAMGRNMTAIRLKNEWPYPTYLIELLQSAWMKAEIERKTDSGTILNALNVKNIPMLRCVVAPRTVMNVFENTARPLRRTMEENIKQLQTLTTLRDTLLPRLISGQLRLPEAEAAMEAVLA